LRYAGLAAHILPIFLKLPLWRKTVLLRSVKA
jgi:hypothetical protein